MLDLVHLSLERSDFAVQPEGNTVSAVATVRNNRPIVDEFRLHVEGLDASAATLAPDTVRLFPHTEATALLTLTAAPGALAGTRHFRLVASSSRDASVESAVEATLNVVAVGEVQLELRPERTRGRTRARSRVLVRNLRNAHAPLRLVATDPQALLRFEMDQMDFVLGPGAETSVGLQIRPPRPGLTGGSREYEFNITLFANEGPLSPPLAGATGTLVQLPLAEWLAGLAALLAAWLTPVLLLLLLLGVGVWYLGAPGAPVAAPEATPVAANAGEATSGQPAVPNADQGSGQSGSAAAPPAPGGALAMAAASGAGEAQGGATAPPTPVVAATPSPVPTAGPPVIARFGLSAAVGEPSPAVPLDWSVRGASSVSLSQSPSDSATSGQYGEVERRDYSLTASNSTGQATQSLSVYVVRPPSIDEFSADHTEIEPGQNVYLLWRTSRALRLFLDETPVDAVEAGSMTVQLSEPHTFTLRAENSAGDVQQTLTVAVAEPTATPVPTRAPSPTPRRG